jgi:hypothetical protein
MYNVCVKLSFSAFSGDDIVVYFQFACCEIDRLLFTKLKLKLVITEYSLPFIVHQQYTCGVVSQSCIQRVWA